MPRGWRRRAVVASVGACALALAGCATALPDTVVVDSQITLGWAHSMTSANHASTEGATAGNLDVAAMTRGQFAEVVDGDAVLDEDFGTVTITDPESFTVRYELAEPQWSDQIPVDVADLMLAWAAGSNVPSLASIGAGDDDEYDGGDVDDEEDGDGDEGAEEDGAGDDGADDSDSEETDGDSEEGENSAEDADADPEVSQEDIERAPTFNSVSSGLEQSIQVVDYDEFEGWIDVRFTHSVEDWRSALEVAVPAHVVGAQAFDLSDPMEAKQAVITAIEDRDEEDLAAIADVWNTGFELPEGDGSNIPAELLLSSGPYRIEQVDQSQPGAQSLQLVVNNDYIGSPTGEYERIELSQIGNTDPLPELGRTIDVAQVAPTSENWERIRDLERVDHGVSTSHDNSMWALMLNVNRGEFDWPNVREVFLRAVPQDDMASAGSGQWSQAYSGTSAMVFTPEMDGHQIAVEDAGFDATLGESLNEEDAAAERSEVGVDDGERVCILYDSGQEYAVAAFAALQEGMAETGWDIRDCGTDDVDAELAEGTDWHAVLANVPVPHTPAEIAAQWGTEGEMSVTGAQNEERDALIDELARTADVYAARDLRVEIEASIVADAVAMPLSMQPVVTVNHRSVDNVQPRNGTAATLTYAAPDWSIADG